MADDETAIVDCGTTKGPIKMQFFRDWSPNGYDRAVTLFEKGFYDHCHLYRVVPNFLVQFGISYSKDQDLLKFSRSHCEDDPQKDPPIEFGEGVMSFAGNGPNSRTSQLFIAYEKRASFGTQLWETPVGKVIEGMDHVKELHSYGDLPPWGKGPEQGKIHGGPEYIQENFPLTDSFTTCTVERITSSGSDAGESKKKKKPEIATAKTVSEPDRKLEHHPHISLSKGAMDMDYTMVLGLVSVLLVITVLLKGLLGSKKTSKTS